MDIARRRMAAVGACLCLFTYQLPAQQPQSLTSEAAAKAAAREGVPERFNIPLGAGGVDFSAHLKGVFVDNVYVSNDDRRGDFILVPELRAGLFMPVGQLNTLTADVGLAYYHYFDNTELNTGNLVVTPDTDLEFNIYSGDFKFTFSESFSYLVTPFYETGGDFYNVYDTGLFERFRNLAGVQATWDLHHLVLNARYRHEDLFSNGSAYDYIDRNSDVVNVRALAELNPSFSAGLETGFGCHNYWETEVNDQFRFSVGPVAAARLAEYLQARAGVGYLRIEYDDVDIILISGENVPYGYLEIEHELTMFIRHSLQVRHEHQAGVNAGNLQGTAVRYDVRWEANPELLINPYANYTWYEESFGPGQSQALYYEKFDYFGIGIGVQWAFMPHWTSSLTYDYRLKDSDDPARGYYYNQLTLGLSYNF